MLLQWLLILSVTSVSATMLMLVSTFFAILPQAETYYGCSRTAILLFSNSFNIFYILITPFMMRIFTKKYVLFVLVSTIMTGVGCFGRWYVGHSYRWALLMTIIVAIAHIPIITAPYGLLKLFKPQHRGYASSIPLFLPVLGINFCILYGMSFIASDGQNNYTIEQQNAEIQNLNKIIAWMGVGSMIATIFFVLKLKDKIEADEKEIKDNQLKQTDGSSIQQNSPLQSEEVIQTQQVPHTFVQHVQHYLCKHFITMIKLICWGSILGVNWTYGSLFGIIFSGQGLSDKQIALIGLAANLSSALFSNLGSWILNYFALQPKSIITCLNIAGIFGAAIITLSTMSPHFQVFFLLLTCIVIMRAGYSSFVSLAFIELQKSSISSVMVSGIFFWIANVVNLIGMQITDLVDTRISMVILTLAVCLCVFSVRKGYALQTQPI